MDLPQWLRDVVASLPFTRLEDRTAWDAWVLWLSPRPDPRPRDKWFGLLMHHPDGRALLNLKGDPEANALHRDANEWIGPGYHMNKLHWVSLDLGHPAFELGLAQQLVEDAWDVTVQSYPQRIQQELRRLA